jgi:hypothetical protein
LYENDRWKLLHVINYFDNHNYFKLSKIINVALFAWKIPAMAHPW